MENGRRIVELSNSVARSSFIALGRTKSYVQLLQYHLSLLYLERFRMLFLTCDKLSILEEGLCAMEASR